MNTFNYDSIPAECPATHKQVKHRAGNFAKEVLLSELGLGGMLVKATNYRLFKQMGMALQTATSKKPLTHGDIQAMGRDASKYLEVFAAAYRELYLTPEQLAGLLKQDKVPAAKAKKAITAYSKLTGKKMTTVNVRKRTDNDKETIAVKESKTPKNLDSVAGISREISELSKTPKNLNSVASIEREIDKLYLMMERLSEQNS